MIEEIIESIQDFWNFLPTWLKASLITAVTGLIILGAINLVLDSKTKAELKQAEEIKENVTKQSQEILVNTGTNAASEVKKAFDDMGNELANSQSDPAVGQTIKNLMSFAGTMLALVIILTIIMAITKK